MTCASAITFATAVAYTTSAIWRTTGFADLATLYFQHDALWLIASVLLLFGCAWVRFPAGGMLSRATGVLTHPRIAVGLLAALVVISGVAGHDLVFDGFSLTRDEVQADLDATIFRAGMLVAPVSPEWRPIAGALQPKFMLPIAGGAGFVSNYLPVNAAVGALVGEWASPLFAALAVVAFFGVARQQVCRPQ